MMKLLKTNTIVNVKMDHVYKYISNLDNLYNDINYLKNSDGVKSVNTESGIECKGKGNELLFKIVNIKGEKTNVVRAKIITEGKHLKRFGNANIVSRLTYENNTTNIETTILSEKTPGFIWRAFIRLAVFVYMFQSRGLEKAYIKRIEELA